MSPNGLAIFVPGLKVLLVEHGYFRTRAFSNINHVAPRVDLCSQFNEGVFDVSYLAQVFLGWYPDTLGSFPPYQDHSRPGF